MTTYCTHQKFENVHHFQFLATNQQAVDEWMSELTAIMRKEGCVRYMLVDIRDFVPPVSYLTEQFKQYQHRYFSPCETRIAFVYKSGTGLLSSIRTLMQAVTLGQNVTIQFFPENADQQAQTWLLQ